MAKKKTKKTVHKKVKKAVKKKISESYQRGKQTAKGKEFDSHIQAKLPGKRKSASGKIYYERRVNRSDKGKLLGVNLYSIRDQYEMGLKAAIEEKKLLKQLKANKSTLLKNEKKVKALRKHLNEINKTIGNNLR